MIIEHTPDGRELGDTQVIAALTGRPPWMVREHCPRDELGRYDVRTALVVLAQVQEPILLTAADAQRYLGIPSGTVRARAHRGQLAPCTDVGGRPLYKLTDLLQES